MQIAIETTRAVARKLLDFALPPRCPGCGRVTDEPHLFCLGCWQALHFLGEPCCSRCGLPFEVEIKGAGECGSCLSDPPPFDRLRAAVAYGELARKVVLKLKYGGRPGVAETLAHFMKRHIAEEGNGCALLVPVPLHRWRIWKRGYNQSALIAQGLASRTGLACELDLLRRVRSTPPLRGLGRRERSLAVRGAFALNPDRKDLVRGRIVILVDDVYTSGATARACARALSKAGAERVDILCWARVLAQGSD